MSIWYFLIEYGTMIILATLTWLGASKMYIGRFVDNPSIITQGLNNFLTKWASLINMIFIITSIITVIPIIVDYFTSKHYICNVSALNVRSAPGTSDSDVLTSIKGQTEVTIISDIAYDNDNDPWIKIKGSGFSGWVSQTKVCTHE